MFSLDSEEESYTENQKVRAITRDTVIGNDSETLDANVTVTGNVFKADGTAAAGKLYVEVPTRLSFSVDQSGNFNSGIFIIKNKSSVAISVSVGQFTETKINSGITVRPLSESLTNKDRSNVHLYLQGDTDIDLGDKSKLNQELVAINPNDSKAIQLLGSAGKDAGTEVDNNGASEEFNLVFKIKKKS